MGQLWTFERSNAKSTMVAIGNSRKSTTPIDQAASAALVSRGLPLHRLESAEGPCDQEIDGHDHDRHDGKSRRERQVVRRAEVFVDDVADEAGVGSPDQEGRDEVAER